MARRTLGLKISPLVFSPSSSLRRGVLCRSFVARSDGGTTAGDSGGGEFSSLPTAGESDGGESRPFFPTADEDDYDENDPLNDPYFGRKPTVYADPNYKVTYYIGDPTRDHPDGHDIYMSEFYHELMYGPPRSPHVKPEDEDLDENTEACWFKDAPLFQDVKPKFETVKGTITEDFGPDCKRWWLEDSAPGENSEARWFKDCISNIRAHQSEEDANASRHVSTDVSPRTAIVNKNFMETIKELSKIVHSHSDKNSDADEAAGKPVLPGAPHVPK